MASPAGSALLERLLQDTQDQAHGRGSHFSSVSPRAQTPAGSIAASDMSAPAVVMSDTLGGARSRHSSPPGVVARRSSAAHSAQPSLDGGPAGAGDVTQSQPLPRAPTAQSSLDNVFSLQPGSSPAAGSAPLAVRAVQTHPVSSQSHMRAFLLIVLLCLRMWVLCLLEEQPRSGLLSLPMCA